MIKNKKAQTDIIFLVMMLFVLALTLIIGIKVFGDILTPLAKDFPNVAATALARDEVNQMFLNWDVMFIVIFGFGVLAAVITAFFIDTHPVFMIVTIILMILFTVFGAYLNNVYEEFRTSSDIRTEANQFPLITFFFDHLPKFMVIAIALVSIVTYSRLRQGGGGI